MRFDQEITGRRVVNGSPGPCRARSLLLDPADDSQRLPDLDWLSVRDLHPGRDHQMVRLRDHCPTHRFVEQGSEDPTVDEPSITFVFWARREERFDSFLATIECETKPDRVLLTASEARVVSDPVDSLFHRNSSSTQFPARLTLPHWGTIPLSAARWTG